MSLWFRNLNSISLCGRVPASLGGRLLHRASFKYVLIHVILKVLDFNPTDVTNYFKRGGDPYKWVPHEMERLEASGEGVS